MTELTEDERRILTYLQESVATGNRYFRAKTIADAVGLSAKQVGVRLAKLADNSDTEDVEIEKWSRARSTTWKVTVG